MNNIELMIEELPIEILIRMLWMDNLREKIANRCLKINDLSYWLEN